MRQKCIDCVFCRKICKGWFACNCLDNYATLGQGKLVPRAYKNYKGNLYNKCQYFIKKEEKK